MYSRLQNYLDEHRGGEAEDQQGLGARRESLGLLAC